jgi:hypothetical protein
MTEPPTPRHVLDRFAEHATEIGHLVYASARLQWSLGELFAALVGTGKPISIAIWNSLKSDRSQRDILEAAAKVALADDADAKSDVFWLLQEADARAIDRNDAVHTAFFFTNNEDGEIVPVPDPMSSPGRLQRLTDSGLPLPGLFAAYHSSLTALYRYADKLTDQFLPTEGERPPWPEKPQLQPSGQSLNRKGSNRQIAAKPPEPQLRSSQE